MQLSIDIPKSEKGVREMERYDWIVVSCSHVDHLYPSVLFCFLAFFMFFSNLRRAFTHLEDSSNRGGSVPLASKGDPEFLL